MFQGDTGKERCGSPKRCSERGIKAVQTASALILQINYAHTLTSGSFSEGCDQRNLITACPSDRETEVCQQARCPRPGGVSSGSEPQRTFEPHCPRHTPLCPLIIGRHVDSGIISRLANTGWMSGFRSFAQRKDNVPHGLVSVLQTIAFTSTLMNTITADETFSRTFGMWSYFGSFHLDEDSPY